jgi:hypothetical protein
MISTGVNTKSAHHTSASLPPPPRKAVRRWGVPIPLRAILACLIPHVWVGVGFLVVLGSQLLVLVFGHHVTGHVTDQTMTHGKDTRYLIAYTYTDDGQRFTEEASVSESAGRNLVRGGPINVTSLHRFGLSRSRIAGTVAPIGSWVGTIIFGVFWNGITFTFVIGMMIEPLRHRWMVRFAHAVSGQIIGTKVHKAKSTTYTALFEYVTSDGWRRDGTMEITKRQYEQLVPCPFTVTVLYDPTGRRKPIVYELARYAVDDSTTATPGVVWTRRG